MKRNLYTLALMLVLCTSASAQKYSVGVAHNLAWLDDAWFKGKEVSFGYKMPKGNWIHARFSSNYQKNALSFEPFSFAQAQLGTSYVLNKNAHRIKLCGEIGLSTLYDWNKSLRYRVIDLRYDDGSYCWIDPDEALFSGYYPGVYMRLEARLKLVHTIDLVTGFGVTRNGSSDPLGWFTTSNARIGITGCFGKNQN